MAIINIIFANYNYFNFLKKIMIRCNYGFISNKLMVVVLGRWKKFNVPQKNTLKFLSDIISCYIFNPRKKNLRKTVCEFMCIKRGNLKEHNGGNLCERQRFTLIIMPFVNKLNLLQMFCVITESPDRNQQKNLKHTFQSLSDKYLHV